jgi:acetyl-CoA carboxylase biotin carboxyl carrier protein
VNISELRELLAAINQTDIEELTLKSDDFELTVRRSGKSSQIASTSTSPILSERATVGTSFTAASVNPIAAASDEPAASISATSVPAPPVQVPPPKNDRRLMEITSPMVGTFYRAPAPDEAPFVDVGDRIRVGQTVCIIEAMKLMNELEAEISGEVVEILVQNGEPVEFGQVLMKVNPG